MTDSRQLPSLNPPETEEAIERTFRGYRMWLQTQTPEQLASHAAELSARLEDQARASLGQVIGQPPQLSDWLTSLDRVSFRSTPTATRPSSPRDRGQEPSLSSRQPSPMDLLASSQRLAPKIAARLVAASARAEARRRA